MTTTPAASKGSHLLRPADPPAAVRAGTVGKLSETNDFLFFSWLLVRMSKTAYSHSSRIYSRCMVGTVTTENVPCLKERIRSCPLANGKNNEQSRVVERRAKVREHIK